MGTGIGIGIGIGLNKRKSWPTYWATLISATVENAAPTHLVLTFPAAAATVATDITATVNGVARAVSSASWTGAVWTVVLASAVEYGDVVVMTFKLTNTVTVTNNVLTYAALLTSIGTGAGVSALRMLVSSNITVTLGVNAKFYSDAGGTADESATWTITTGALRLIYLKCTTGTATMTFSDITKVNYWGNVGTSGWDSGANAPRITFAVNKLSALIQTWVTGTATLSGAFASTLTDLRINNSAVTWTYSGALPTGLKTIYIDSNNVTWTYSGALPNGMTSIIMLGNLLDWTGLSIGETGNVALLLMNNYRVAKMSSADMITLLTQMTNRAGTLPASITINDYADYAAPPAGVVTAVDTLKTTKSVTTVTLGA